MRRPILWIALAVLLVGAGGAAWYFLLGPGATMSLEEARKKFGAKYDEKRAQFKKIAEKLPPAGSVGGNTSAQGLDPKPVYDVKADDFNTEIVMFAQLSDPDVELREKKEPDLILTDGKMLSNMTMLGPKSKLQVPLEKKAIKALESALDHQYLVVLRPLTYVRPLMITDKTYSPGSLDLEGFVVDLRDDKIRASFRVRATTKSETTAVVRDGVITKEEIEASAYSTLYENARDAVRAALIQTTGGTFVFDRYK